MSASAEPLPADSPPPTDYRGIAVLGVVVGLLAGAAWIVLPGLSAVVVVLGFYLTVKSQSPVADRADAPRKVASCAFWSAGVGLLAALGLWATEYTFPSVGLAGVALGLMGLRHVRESGGKLGGRGFAAFGLVLGIVHVAVAGYTVTRPQPTFARLY